MCINGEYTPPICGICALKLTNKIHGLPEGTMFRGEMAQQMYDDAQDYIDERMFEEVRRRKLKSLKGDIIK